MEKNICKLTLRVTEEEKREIERRASAAGMTRNDYVKAQALGSSPFPSCSDTKLRRDMVAQMSRLPAEMTNARMAQSWAQMDHVISSWTKETMDILKEGL